MNASGPDLRDRARGAFLGLASGDALGAPLVGMGREQAQIRHATVTTFLGGGLYLLAPGETTGRVAFVRAAAVALLDMDADADADPARLREAYLRTRETAGPGVGEATQASLGRMADGMDPAAAVREAHEAVERRSAGIGPALRAVAFALRFHADAGVLGRHVLADAAGTHLDPRAGAAALALALWVREHLRGEDDPEAALERVRTRLAERPELPDVLPAPEAVKRVAVRATGFAPDVLHAVAVHVRRAKSPRAAIVRAVNEAGDAAALGAAVGAVAGARFGAAALPAAWRNLLRGATSWETLADRLVAPKA